MRQKKLIILALGGNALIKAGQRGSNDEQIENIKQTVKHIYRLAISDKYQIIITHGNGPQVGNLLIQQEASKNQVPGLPMYLCGAMSQGQIGYLLENAIQNSLIKEKINRPVAAIVTQIKVDHQSSSFQNPSKPVGPFYLQHEAELIARKTGHVYKQDSNRGWRRVVASPEPIKIIELATIKNLIDKNIIVICCGGGGIPVAEINGKLVGVDAVIDKDHASALLADKIKADFLVIVTAVDAVYINFGQPDEKKIDKINSLSLKKYLKQNQFAPGSMKPKIEAAINFVSQNKKRKVIITSIEKLELALKGKAGTIIKD